MATTKSLSLFLFFLSTVSRSLVRSQTASTTTTKFTFNGFKGNQSAIHNVGSAKITADGLLRLTDKTQNVLGTAFYRQPVRLLTERSVSFPNAAVHSFSTSFVFVITPPVSGAGGYGFTFALSPSSDRPGAEPDQFMGLLNKSTNGNSSNHVFAVEFDTINGFKDGMDSMGNHIGLNINDLRSEYQETVFYYEVYGRKEDFQLQSGEPIRAQIDYDGPSGTLNITVYPTKLISKPSTPSISRPVNLSGIVKDKMYVGFTASTGISGASSHYIMGWSFSSVDGESADELDLSNLPPPPKKNRRKTDYNPQVVALISALSAVTLVMLFLLSIFARYRKRMQEDVLEDWEIDYPHRFRYKNLYAATNGFRASEIIGTGGFGSVYRGMSGSESIAVKKITPNSMQGVREFVSEIESLGRLRHKNLVNLQGWCKHKNDLLLIYDYIPNGSLDSLLYKKPRTHRVVLTWDERFAIVKGIASGLTYLHEEWEQVVIHRDVKSSNVLIDSDMNPRLGDFGLARLYDRGTMSHTTNVVGTIGYIAPELARNGKASTASDVFAFGVLILEVVSGRKPTDSGNFFLADWVMELYECGEILRAVDGRLGSDYVEDEVKLALVVGLLCCHQNAAFRPPMRRVLRFLNRDDVVPVVDSSWGSVNSSRDEFGSNFLRYVSSDMATSSDSSLSVTVARVSSSSAVTVRQ